MCAFSKPDVPEVPVARERAAARAPDNGTVQSTARRTSDRVRAGASTLLTSGTGVGSQASTGKATLLGQ